MTRAKEGLTTLVQGHVLLKEHEFIEVDGVKMLSEGTVLLDKTNAVHPQNMARLFGRALANEDNAFIKTIAFGNGGTQVDVTGDITYNTPRDGLQLGDGEWEARLYHETYREIVDDSDINIGDGDGASPGDDPDSIEHVSGPGVRSIENLLSGSTVTSVIVSATLNPFEPSGQVISQQGGVDGEDNLESDFTFDEIGLFTPGAPAVNTAGYQNVDVGDKNNLNDSGLSINTSYQFQIAVDGASAATITILTPGVGTGDGVSAPLNAITFGDLVTLLNVASADLDTAGAFAAITDSDPSQLGGFETFGFLRFESQLAGSTSSISLTDIDLFTNLSGFASIQSPIPGEDAGIRNDPINPTTERERMLTHIVFSPVLKSADRILTLTYTLIITVAPTA